MTRSNVVFDEPAWWHRPHGQLAMALALTIAALAIWAAVFSGDEVPLEPRASRSSFAAARPVPRPAEAIAPAAPTPAVAARAAATPAAHVQPPLSTMIAPGVHITPLSVPPGTVPMPAGPNPNDSESEN